MHFQMRHTGLELINLAAIFLYVLCTVQEFHCQLDFAAALLNLVIGVAYGAICGYFGGKVDMILMRLVDIIYSVPTLLYVILIMLIFGSNIFSMLLAIGNKQLGWYGASCKRTDFDIEGAGVRIGCLCNRCKQKRIMFKHLIVNCMGPIIVNTTLMVPNAIFTEAFLAFVGIGISIPQASWGTMANDARSLIQSQPIQIIWPVLAICLTMLSLNFIGDGLSEALDPKKK